MIFKKISFLFPFLLMNMLGLAQQPKVAEYPEIGYIQTFEYFGEFNKWVPMTNKFVGFTINDCDFLTTFDAILEYERKNDWSNKIKLQVTIAGKTVEGRLKTLGVNPLGLNLACIELDPSIKIKKFSLSLSKEQFYTFPMALGASGTPYLDNSHKIIGMSTGKDIITNDDINLFDRVIIKSYPSPWPHLINR